jgi:hypothetical protein
MKKNQVFFTLLVFVVLVSLLVFKKGGPYYEHDITLAFEKDGCKVYRFLSYDGRVHKTHYFTSCKGDVIDPDEINPTEVGP